MKKDNSSKIFLGVLIVVISALHAEKIRSKEVSAKGGASSVIVSTENDKPTGYKLQLPINQVDLPNLLNLIP